MSLVMTLLVRDEADIVDAQIAFHLNAGVDFVIAMDNRSEDGTTEILERYEQDGRVHLIREPGDDMQQARWVTRMARLAATEFEADWVINSDADEFWWPRGGSLKDVFATVPHRFGVVQGCWRHFVPRPDDGSSFAERMTIRLARPAFAGDKTTVFHAHQKVAHRASPEVEVDAGNHYVRGPGLDPLPAWYPIEVLHFSLRSIAQLARKGRGGWYRNPAYVPAEHQRRVDEALSTGRLADYFASFVASDDELAEGLADGTYAVDTRLRDVLRVLRERSVAAGRPGFCPPDPVERPVPLPARTIEEDSAYATETSALVDLDSVVRSEARVDALDTRLSAVERSPWGRLAARRGTLRAAVD